MLQQFNDRLAELTARQRQKSNWTASKDRVKEQLEKKKQALSWLEDRLSQEQRDVDRLKGMTLGALFYSLIGKKQEKLTEEEAELLQVKLEHEEAADTVAELQQEFDGLVAKLAGVRNIDGEFQAALREKELYIRQEHPGLAAQLTRLSEEETATEADAKELREAVKAGRSALSSLERAGKLLDSARSWGTADMLGGGLLTTMVKHDRIDEARSAIHSAQSGLRKFEAELRDVQRDVRINIDIGSMLTFADYMFDGFITDWIVQGRIKEAAGQVGDSTAAVRRIVGELESELSRRDRVIAELRRRQSSMIEQA